MAETDYELLTKLLHQLAAGVPDATIVSVFRQIAKRVDKTTHLEIVSKGAMDELRRELEEERQKEKASPYDASVGMDDVQAILTKALAELKEREAGLRKEIYADLEREKEAFMVSQRLARDKLKMDEARMKQNLVPLKEDLDRKKKELDSGWAKLHQAERDFALKQSKARRSSDPSSTPYTPRPRK